MQVDPKIAFWFGVWTFILQGLANGSGHLPNTFSPTIQTSIISWCAFFAWINTGVMTAFAGYSSQLRGPLVSQPLLPVAKAVLIFVLGGMVFFAAPNAQADAKTLHHRGKDFVQHALHARQFIAKSRLPIPLPSLSSVILTPVSSSETPEQTIDKIRQWVANDAVADLTIAISLASKANNNVTGKCWADLKSFALAVQSLPPLSGNANVAQGTAPPEPPASLPKLHIATDVEIGTELLINLQPNAPIVVDCQGIANFYKMTAANFVTGVVTGALSISKLAPIIP